VFSGEEPEGIGVPTEVLVICDNAGDRGSK